MSKLNLNQRDTEYGALTVRRGPITCLHLMWKILTGQIVNKTSLWEKKGCKRKGEKTNDRL